MAEYMQPIWQIFLLLAISAWMCVPSNARQLRGVVRATAVSTGGHATSISKGVRDTDVTTQAAAAHDGNATAILAAVDGGKHTIATVTDGNVTATYTEHIPSVTWEAAPPCLAANNDTIAKDQQGRLWGFEHGRSCAIKPIPRNTWDDAPACVNAQQGSITVDYSGRLWGFEHGLSCAFKPLSTDELFYSAPPCPFPPKQHNVQRRDEKGHLWGWNVLTLASCAFYSPILTSLKESSAKAAAISTGGKAISTSGASGDSDVITQAGATGGGNANASLSAVDGGKQTLAVLSAGNTTIIYQENVPRVSWDNAPACLGASKDTVTKDKQGRLWGFENGASCAIKSINLTALWGKAPECVNVTYDAVKVDSRGHIWGYQDSTYCAVRSRDAAAWLTAISCSFTANESNIKYDAEGHLWGWNPETNTSCAFHNGSKALKLGARKLLGFEPVSPTEAQRSSDLAWLAALPCTGAASAYSVLKDTSGNHWGLNILTREYCAFRSMQDSRNPLKGSTAATSLEASVAHKSDSNKDHMPATVKVPDVSGWEAAPDCKDAIGNVIPDSHGRLWGWDAGHHRSCAYKELKLRNSSDEAWYWTPRCSFSVTAYNAVEDQQGHLWGWDVQAKAICAFRQKSRRLLAEAASIALAQASGGLPVGQAQALATGDNSAAASQAAAQSTEADVQALAQAQAVTQGDNATSKAKTQVATGDATGSSVSQATAEAAGDKAQSQADAQAQSTGGQAAAQAAATATATAATNSSNPQLTGSAAGEGNCPTCQGGSAVAQSAAQANATMRTTGHGTCTGCKGGVAGNSALASTTNPFTQEAPQPSPALTPFMAAVDARAAAQAAVPSSPAPTSAPSPSLRPVSSPAPVSTEATAQAVSSSPQPTPASKATAAAQAAASSTIVTWDNTPACGNKPEGKTGRYDADGRLWGFENGKSCACKGACTAESSSRSNAVATGQASTTATPFVTWDNAPDCFATPEGALAKFDADGRLWGYERGSSCACKGGCSASHTRAAAASSGAQGGSSSSSSNAQAVAVSWDAAPTCAATKPADGVKDVNGRPWGFENGTSCACKGTSQAVAHAAASAQAASNAEATATPQATTTVTTHPASANSISPPPSPDLLSSPSAAAIQVAQSTAMGQASNEQPSASDVPSPSPSPDPALATAAAMAQAHAVVAANANGAAKSTAQATAASQVATAQSMAQAAVTAGTAVASTTAQAVAGSNGRHLLQTATPPTSTVTLDAPVVDFGEADPASSVVESPEAQGNAPGRAVPSSQPAVQSTAPTTNTSSASAPISDISPSTSAVEGLAPATVNGTVRAAGDMTVPAEPVRPADPVHVESNDVATTWSNAPVCTGKPTNKTAVEDTLGRLWWFENGKSCAYRKDDNNSLYYEGYKEVKWETAPACEGTPTLNTSTPDADGRMWGWDKRAQKSCKYANSDGKAVTQDSVL